MQTWEYMTAIQDAADLDSLQTAIQDAIDAKVWWDILAPDLADSLSVFGGPEPRDTEGIYSWDDKSVLYIQGTRAWIEPRVSDEDEMRALPTAQVRLVGDLDDLQRADESVAYLLQQRALADELVTHLPPLITEEFSSQTLIQAARKLEARGYGRVVVGRKGKQTRILWDPKIQDSQTVQYTIQLREDHVVRFNLPLDVTQDELDRFRDYLYTLVIPD